MNAHDHQRGHHKELWETDVALAETRQARLNIDVDRIYMLIRYIFIEYIIVRIAIYSVSRLSA